MKEYFVTTEDTEDVPVKRPTRGPVEPVSTVCASQKLDEIFKGGKDLKVSYEVPRLEGVDFVSERTTGMDPPPEEQFTPKTGGLGLKRKMNQEEKTGMRFVKKAKTLAEKRDQLQDEILKYGVAAIEKMYPRQSMFQQPLKKIIPKATGVRGSPIKMKPKPSGLDFDEIDVRKILKPLSHAKYIREPDYDHMVYINRREGLVPLSSLCKENTKTVLR